eukprot:gnl/MRDRNA2_/MRDRNA2_101791_c0_seq1.p1 gnl/MRDRNA2_/MRDRNA2_101791_c0~~gnl/MRDRNA2_/MRDRNA2_101791_c0_seq1.p1  ORF type:complete len:151 (+),score=29.73 gnl/MRDRNA2_/MRDRNA2_101791_c0_seq1:67-519(+)
MWKALSKLVVLMVQVTQVTAQHAEESPWMPQSEQVKYIRLAQKKQMRAVMHEAVKRGGMVSAADVWEPVKKMPNPVGAGALVDTKKTGFPEAVEAVWENMTPFTTGILLGILTSLAVFSALAITNQYCVAHDKNKDNENMSLGKGQLHYT